MSYEKNTISGAKGITFAGETFVVPETHDVIETLFNPLLKKSHFELIILSVLASNGIVFWLVQDSQLRVSIFIVLYVFWRLSYNFGIGYLLREQSNHSKLVNWAKKYATFDTNNGGWLTKVLRAEVKSQMSPGYEIEDYPIEFNTWLIFRKIVDLILMSDFFSFMGLVVASSINKDYQFINDQSTWLVSLRLIVGSVLILFNYWVKVNAHNTIKDYAWYWGDFFFRQVNNEELIFDGVFEMFPHPMYSVGYIGYYGFALISKSYTVLIVAIFGHFLQMIFLHFIEDPHIDKIYGNPDDEAEKILELRRLKIFDNQKPLVGLWNFSYLRASDLVNVIITFTYAILIPYLSSFQSGESDNLGKALFILAVILKLSESLIIDILLILQSYYKTFTRWYLAHDIPVEKSLNNWAVIFNTLINLTYSSFFGLNFYRFLTNSHQSLYDWFYLRCFLGVLLIATQVWINSSIIDSIGYFGWFYGDFFIPKAKSGLTKAGVYRYLNNPEQLFGSCGIMGVTLISPTLENFVCCILWVVNNFVRINFIEKIHMISIYGVHEVLKDSGVTKTVKKHLLPTAIQRRFSDSNGTKRSSLTESLDSFIREMRNSENKLTRHNIIDLSKNLKFSDSDYQISFKAENYTTGMPIEVYWEAPPNHSSRDWIGLYKIVQTTFSRNKTLISSSGRWVWCTENKGTHIFSGEKLFWEEGVYEFRYHLDGKHDVAFISQPFEIRHPKIDLTEDIENDALNLKESIFRFLIPVESIDSPLAAEAQKSGAALKDYKTLSNLILAATGIKIDWKLFLEDGLTLRKLSAKLLNIRDVLDKLSSPHEVSTVKKNE